MTILVVAGLHQSSRQEWHICAASAWLVQPSLINQSFAGCALLNCVMSFTRELPTVGNALSWCKSLTILNEAILPCFP